MIKADIYKPTFMLLMVIHLVWLTSCGSNNRKQPQKATEVAGCAQSLQVLIKHSGWKSPFKSNFTAEIESTDDKKLRVQLLSPPNGGSRTAHTIGWIVIDEQKKTLSDITNDPENPEPITYQLKDWNRFITCFHEDAENPSTTGPVLQLSDLFTEGSTTAFSPKDLNKDEPNIKQFKAKLIRFEQQHKGDQLNTEDVSILINHEVFDNSNTYVNSSWLAYFLNKYHISPLKLNDAFEQAITQEDLIAVKILLQHGFIVSDQQLKAARLAKENSVRLTHYNLQNKGLDESGDPTFYDEKKSKIDAIQQLINLQYQANIIQDNDGFTNLREYKSKTSNIIRRIQNAEHIKVLDNTGEWWQVETVSGQKGYVFWTRIKSGKVTR
ncbi:SH3 domain-containing protein [Mucilaginibacter sp. PAMB04168]|uniref:SH3 domain-containing protein n=1 Tax=Mucilaginibacter sp. PAMB04168 TaxID=3138567 RepID=UPI0031F6FA55